MNREILNIVNKVLSEEITGKVRNLKNKIFEDKGMKKQMCSECGGKMLEGECMECGNMYESEIGETLKGGQKKIDKNKNNKIDSEDFKLLRKGKKSETKENEMYELHLDESTGEKFIFSESDMVDIIENIVLEEKSKKPKKGKNSDLPKSVTKDSQSKSKSENDKYIASVVKKMSTYLKDGSKGKYEMNPEHFPKGNGELEKMDKMAFEMSPDNEDFNYEIAGLNIPVSDGVQFDDDLMTKHYEGSSETGNAHGGNALKSDANTRFNEFRKKRTLDKLKNQSYKRVPTPVFNEKSGQGKGQGPKIKLESVNDTEVKNKPTENKHIITEVEKIKNLMGYNQKTQ